MKPNFLSITFWFNIYDDHQKFIDIINNNLVNEFTEIKVYDQDDNNLFKPKLTAFNRQNNNNLTFSKVNLQYNMELIDINKFSDIALKIYEMLADNGIVVMHTAIYAGVELVDNNALKTITQNLLNSSVSGQNLIDVNLHFGIKCEDAFYKIISLMNKRQIELPRKYDSLNREIPIPLISWMDATLKDEVIDISYEINDKLLFDTEKNYHTELAYLNKMLYILKNNLEDDINSLINKGKI